MKKDKSDKGFTLVEIMVAMVVLSIGLLGMAAMTVMVMKAGRGANDLQAATNICQLKLEELKDLGSADWSTLGSANPADLDANAKGLQSEAIAKETDLNARGKTLSDEGGDTSLGPFRYTRMFVICKGEDGPFDASTDTGTNFTTDCAVDPSNTLTRSQWLNCKDTDIAGLLGSGNNEKKIKVLCTWMDRGGQCHSVHLETVSVRS